MAKGSLSFSIALNLLTENFKKGTSSVKNSLRSVQMQVITFAAALGVGGIGLSNLVSRMIDVARSTSRITTALRNVSGSTSLYADNLRYLNDLAKKYGLEVTSLIDSYTKFTAAANLSGMAMEDQRKVFESVSRTVTAFGLSADEANGVFLALSQMMSKGKVSSEELRLQMGEKLPIAIQAMAKAAGVSVGELDGMLKKGQLLAKDILPKFADALNEFTPNVDTDNIETSINRLKNLLGDAVVSTGIQDTYKSLIDKVTYIVKVGADNISLVVSNLIAILTGSILGKFFAWLMTQLAIAQRSAMVTAQRAAKEAGVAFDEMTWKANSAAATMKAAFSRLSAAVGAAFMSMVPTAIFTGIALLVANLVSAYKEAKRVRSIFSDLKKETDSAPATREVVELKALQKIAEDTTKTARERKAALDEVANRLNLVKSKNESDLDYQKRINEEIRKRIILLEQTARAELFATKKAEVDAKIDDIKQKLGITNMPSGAMDVMAANLQSYRDTGSSAALQKAINEYAYYIRKSGLDFARGYENLLIEFSGLQQFSNYAATQLEGAIAKTLGTTATGGGGTVVGGDAKETPLQKAEAERAKKLAELNAQLEINLLTEGKYGLSQQEVYKAYDELNAQLLADAMASEDMSILKSKYIENLKDAVAHPLYNEEQDRLEKAQKDYREGLQEINNLLASGKITEKEKNEKVQELIDTITNTIGALLGGDAAMNEFFQELKGLQTSKPVEKKKHDPRATATDILNNDDYTDQDKLEALKFSASRSAKQLVADLEDLQNNHDLSLEEAMKIGKARTAVKDLKNELAELSYDSVRGLMGSVDGVMNAFDRLSDVFSDVDSSGWDKIMATFTALTSVVDGIMGVVSAIEKMTMVIDLLANARRTAAAIDTASTATELGNAGSKVAANTSVAASGAAASVAGIPIVGLAMAVAAVGTIMALLSNLPRFTGGGIMSGKSKTGDLNLARINDGEMILNGTQQYNLFRQLNNPGRTGGAIVVSGELRARGTELIAVIDNTTRKRNRGR